ncbi:addiction module antidote protein [Rubritalea profundi]|uniref:Putative addiction module antidote protein n=1 Tax=Rubritalea profundi TaxID=1658618 RepID=A0A2S7U320_9BACT|nr:addiction module antidote protein [Rubritalea profundi]PQJ28784.1 putative addiction module antidote protein [Rubritalea profundi]
MTNNKTWSEYRKSYLSDPEKAKSYLETAFEEFQTDDDRAALMLALRNVAEAQGGISKLAESVDMKRENLYRTLSEKGNPTLETLRDILNGLHLKIRLEPMVETS